MGGGATPLRLAWAVRAGLGAIACALTTVAAAPAFAQAPSLGLDVQTPVDPVNEATEQVAQAAGPVDDATAGVVEGMTATTDPVVGLAADVAGAAEPVVDAAVPPLDAVQPAVRLSAPAVPLTDVVRDVTRPVGGSRPSRQSAQQGRDGSSQPGGGSAGRGSGGPPGGGSDLDRARHSSAASASSAPVFEGPDTAFPGAPAGAADDPAAPAGRHGAERTHAAARGEAGRHGTAPGPWVALLDLPRLSGASLTTAAPTEATPGSSGAATSAWPDGQPAPAPSGPGGVAAAASAAAGGAAPVLALLVLLLLAAPSLSRFLRTVPAFLRPAPFVCALERPG